MIMTGNEKILDGLMREAYEVEGDDNPLVKLLRVVMNMEYRIKALETKPDLIPMPIFSGIPNTPVIPYLEIEEIGFPPVEASKELNENERLLYNHLVSKGCSWEDAAAIAREVEETTKREKAE
jgi:hypothetical protein